MKKIYLFWLLMIAPLTMTAVLASSYEWDLSPDISDGLEVSLPCNPTSVSNGTVNATTCAITCHSNYTLNGTTCVANQQWGGWGGGWWTPQDYCPGGDYSPSLYDGKCAATTWAITTWSITTGSTWGGGSNWGWGTAGGSIVWSTYSTELNNAYLYAYSIGITTMWTIQEANLDGNLIRSHMAKMMVNFAVRVLNKQPNNSLSCIFTDIANESAELQWYIKLACQLGIMWYHSDGVTQKDTFNPNDIVTRAQFGTVLSRVLRDGQYNTDPGVWEYYLNHLQALVDNGIITNDNPTLVELRGYVMLMLMRAAE